MATNIKRSLFIGAGGTGMDTLIATKKFYYDTFGEMPPMVALLGVDTDTGYYDRKVVSRLGAEVKLAKGEICKITVKDPFPKYRNNEDMFKWMPTLNEQYLRSLEYGAGQVRSNGRFAVLFNKTSFTTSLATKLQSIANMQIADSQKYDCSDNCVYVHVVFSISGGTGCGTFIDLLCLIDDYCRQNVASSYKIYAYGILPEIFDAMRPGSPDMANIMPNAYGALMDADYLYSLRTKKNANFTVTYPGGSFNIDHFPIEWMTVIGNGNADGDQVTTISQITEMLGLSLVTMSGDFGQQQQSPLDNITTQLSNFKVLPNKDAWLCGMGMSEILFDSDIIARLYSAKASRALIAKMIGVTPNKDFNKEVNSWVNRPDIDICEHDKDPLIDSLLSKKPKRAFEDSDIDVSPKDDVDKFFNDSKIIPSSNGMKDIVDAISDRVTSGLHSLIISFVNTEFGIGDAIKFLDELEIQISIYSSEMVEECQQFKSNAEQGQNYLNDALKQIEEANNLSFFTIGKKARIADAKDHLVSIVNNVAETKREIVRRENAIKVYNNISIAIANEKKSLESFVTSLKSVDEYFARVEAKMQSANADSSQVFVINLHREYFNNITVSATDYSVADFSKSVDVADAIYGLLNYPSANIQERISAYIQNLSVTQSWKNTGIEDILKNLAVDDYNSLMKRAIKKSSPLIAPNFRSTITQNGGILNDLFIIGVPDSSNTVLSDPQIDVSLEEKRMTLDEFCDADKKPTIASLGGKDRIFIYRLQSAFPPFALPGINNYKQKYDQRREIVDFHFDQRVENAMMSEGFSLFPAENDEELLKLWVMSFIMGRITNVNGKYKLTTKVKELRGLNDQYTLNEGNNRREEAYKNFKAIKGLVRDEIQKAIEDFDRNMRPDELKAFYQNIKKKDKDIDVYFTEYSQVNYEKKTLIYGGATHAPILNLIQREEEFVEKQLG